MDRPRATEDAGEDRYLVRKVFLEVVGGPATGTRYVSSTGVLSVGKGEGAHLRIDDPSVADFHFELHLSPDAPVRLRALAPLILDGVEVFEAYPVEGARIEIGDTTLMVSAIAGRAELPASPHTSFGGLRGQTRVMRAVFAALERVAPTGVSVLLTGETGTGKDLAAESIHGGSSRAAGPFIAVDCSAIPDTLLEAELFGHERGAFTGADRRRAGAFASASGGTLFLDEIGELPPDLQPKLLRAIESRTVRPVGSTQSVAVDVRLIAATNRDLRAEVSAGRFRADLYYRAAVVEITLPPLRERLDDLPLLLATILDTLRAGERPEAAALLAPAWLAEMRRRPWPGNVRELRNYVERCLAMRAAQPLPEAPADTIDLSEPFAPARDRWLHAHEHRYLEALLREHGGRVSAAARAAGVDRVQLYRLLWNQGLVEKKRVSEAPGDAAAGTATPDPARPRGPRR